VKTTAIRVLIAAATTLGSSAAFAQAPPAPPTWAPPAMPEPPPPPQEPAAAPQAYVPPAPAALHAYAAPPPAAPYAYATAPVAPAGQWVHTRQYGWIWMPYGPSYTYVAGRHVAYTYAYYPRSGWRWVSAPWVMNVGPTPFWGRLGPSRFAWYGNPGFRGRVVEHGGWRARPVPRRHAPHVTPRNEAVRVARHHR
jgi:hypothetical protein